MVAVAVTDSVGEGEAVGIEVGNASGIADALTVATIDLTWVVVGTST